MEPERDSASSSQKASLLHHLLGTLVFVSVFIVSFWSKLPVPISNSRYTNKTEDNSTEQEKNRERISDFSAPDKSAFHEPPHAPPHQYDSNDEKRDRYNRGIFWLQFLTLIALVVYASFTYGILEETQKSANAAQRTVGEIQQQTNLMQKQIEGTMAAIVSKQFRISWPNKQAYLSVILDNRGKAIASTIHANFRLVKVSVPGDKVTDDTLPSWEFDVPEIAPSRDYPIEKGIYLNISREGLTGYRNIPKAIKITGEFTYSDGFKVKSEAICYYILGTFKGTSQGNLETPIACDGLPAQIAFYKPLM